LDIEEAQAAGGVGAEFGEGPEDGDDEKQQHGAAEALAVARGGRGVVELEGIGGQGDLAS
jgi:hypothetical protein